MADSKSTLMTKQRAALFIDGANLYATTKALGFDIDYKKLLRHFQDKYDLVRASYYTAMIEDQEYSSIRPLIDWLDYNGFSVITKPVREFTDSAGRRRFKGNMDIELTIDMLDLAPRLDVAILFSGDGDFKPVFAATARRGVRNLVYSTIQTQPSMISDDLRRQADEFIDISTCADVFGRVGDERPTRPARAAASTSTTPVPRRTLGVTERYGIRSPMDDGADD